MLLESGSFTGLCVDSKFQKSVMSERVYHSSLASLLNREVLLQDMPVDSFGYTNCSVHSQVYSRLRYLLGTTYLLDFIEDSQFQIGRELRIRYEY